MKTDEIIKRVDAILRKSTGSRSKSPTHTLIFFGNDQSQDSVAALKLIMQIEDEFGITVEDEEITPENFNTVENLIRYLELKLA